MLNRSWIFIVVLIAVCLQHSRGAKIPVLKKVVNKSNTIRESVKTSGTSNAVPMVDTGAMYYITINVGTPPQSFNVQLDTGSSTLAIPTPYCANTCPSGVDMYNATTSSTSSDVPCTGSCAGNCYPNTNNCFFELSYGDGSGVNGTLVQDVVQVGPYSAPSVFGQIMWESQGFENPPTDGIFGIAYNTLNANPAPEYTVWDNIVASYDIRDLFTICITEEGGSLSLGSFDLETCGTPGTPTFASTAILQSNGGFEYYIVGLTDLLIGGTSIGQPASYYTNSIVDSGTTMLVLGETAFNNAANAILSYCFNNNLSFCSSLQNGYIFPASPSQFVGFPTLSFVFQTLNSDSTFSINVGPSEYFRTDLAGGNGMYTFGISSQPDGSGFILGDTFMLNKTIVFDRQNSAVSFAVPATPLPSGSLCFSSNVNYSLSSGLLNFPFYPFAGQSYLISYHLQIAQQGSNAILATLPLSSLSQTSIDLLAAANMALQEQTTYTVTLLAVNALDSSSTNNLTCSTSFTTPSGRMPMPTTNTVSYNWDLASGALLNTTIPPNANPLASSINVQPVSQGTGGVVSPSATAPSSLQFAGTTFLLEAFGSNGALLNSSQTSFSSPIRLAVDYSTSTAASTLSISEQASLGLWIYLPSAGKWVSASSTCPQSSAHRSVDTARHVITETVCHLTQFAAFFTADASPSPTPNNNTNGGLTVGQNIIIALSIFAACVISYFLWRRLKDRPKATAVSSNYISMEDSPYGKN